MESDEGDIEMAPQDREQLHIEDRDDEDEDNRHPLNREEEEVDANTGTVELDSDGSPNFYWTKDFGMMDKRFEVDMAIPDNVYPVQFGIKMNWYYETPPGYSLLFTHPFNRPELPFYVPSGIVDSDIWGLPIFIPFFIKRGFEGVIKAGTPLIQMLPIKREPWSIEIDSSKESIERNKIREEKRRSHITAHYKKTTWQRKQY